MVGVPGLGGRAVAARVRVSFFSLLLLGAAGLPRARAAEPANPEAARARMTELRAEIAHHDALYHRQAAPEISDFAYDQLKAELASLERAHPELAGAAATVSLFGDDRTGRFPTCRHHEPMGGLEKTYDESDLRAYHDRLAERLGRNDLDYVIEPKFDGLAISVTFENGRLVRAVTRGDGREGDDITGNVLTIRSLRRELSPTAPDGSPNPIPELIELRGEIYLCFDEFARINREQEAAGEPPFANPRNLAAGSARLSDPREVAARRLDIVFHGWGACEPASMQPQTQRGFHRQVRAWGLPAVADTWGARGSDGIWAAVQACARARHAFAYPVDGAVVKLDPVELQREAGATDTAPRWAIACKFAPDRAETRLLGITLQAGRTGVLTPIAELAPVRLAGTTVSRASLHNRNVIARLDLRVGDWVIVEKAGEIIPVIAGVNMARRASGLAPYVFPEACPACGAAVVPSAGHAAVCCPNMSCPARVQRRLEHFASRGCVDIEGLGPATIAALVDSGRVASIADLYRSDRDAALSPLLLAAIERSRRAELWRFIVGLGIPRIGAATAKDLAQAFGSLEALAAAGPADFEEGGVAAEAGIGPATARAILAHFAEPQNRAIVTDLIALGVQPAQPPAATESGPPLAGRVFVLSGRLSSMSRAEATRRIEAGGGRVRGSVSGTTDFLLAGTDPGENLTEARALGVPVIDEAELLRLLDGP